MSGVSSLNLPDIVAYHELEPYGDLPEFLEIMIAMDNVFIKHYSKSE